MKELGFTIRIGKKEEKEMDELSFNEMANTVQSLAILIDARMMEAAWELCIQDSYISVLDKIWGHTDEGEEDLAMEELIVMAMILSEDCRILLEKMIRPNKTAVSIFLDFFCEYLVDAHLINQADRLAARLKMASYEDSEEEHEEEEETEELHDIHYDEVKSFFKKEAEADE